MTRNALLCALACIGGCGSVSTGAPDAGHGTVDASSTHWPNGWQYCKEVTVNGTFSDDYSHLLQLTSNELPAGHVASDLADLRFYLGACGSDDDTQSPLPMWIEQASAGTGMVWTRTPVAANAGVLAMYYGNSAAPSVSSGDQTFPFFDDFDGSAIDTTKWTAARPASSATACATDTYTVGNGKLTMEEGSTDPYPATCIRDLVGATTFTPTSAYDIRMDLVGVQIPNWGGLGANAGGYRAAEAGFLDGDPATRTSGAYVEASEAGIYIRTYANAAYTSGADESTTIVPTSSNDISLEWSPTALTWFSNGIMIEQNGTDVPTTALSAQLEASSWSNTSPTGKIVVDRVIVRRSVSPGPSYVFGTEQTP